MHTRVIGIVMLVGLFLMINVTYAQKLVVHNDNDDGNISFDLFQTTNTKGVVLTTDYLGSSALSFINTHPLEVLATGIGPTQGDDIVRYFNGKIYVLNRFGYDRIDVFSAEEPYTYLYNFSTGTGTNPQDIAFISESKAYVTCYDSCDLLIVNPSTGDHLGTIDLSSFADDDGIPEMHRMLALQFRGKHRVYVTVQRLNRSAFYAPTDTSYLVEINADTDTVLHGIELEKTNPISTPFLDGYYVVVVCVGSWFDPADGGVERIHLFSNSAEGCILTEQEAGGNIINYDIYPRYRGRRGCIRMWIEERFPVFAKNRTEVFLVSDPLWNTHLVHRYTTDKKIREIYGTSGYNLPDCAVSNNGFVFLCDRSADASGIRVFDARTGDQITQQPLQVGLLPPGMITLY
ncbi:MAG: hypothetical protein QXL17_05570 [Candidatus Thermoplasmatota archaeon]